MKTPNTKIIFFGTPSVSADVLEALVKNGLEVSLIVTNEDKPIGRKHLITPPPVKVVAEKYNIPFIQPKKLSEVDWSRFDLAQSVGIVVAYGKIIPESVINLFPNGLLNIHYSLLPKWRGASPVESSILSGDAITGVSIQKLIFKLDAGAVIAEEKVEIDNAITTPELKNKLTDAGIKLLLETLPKYLAGEITPREQDENLATHCKKIEKADGEIKESDSDIEKWRKYRAYFGWPGTFYFDSAGKRNKITLADFKNEKFIIKKIIPEGKTEVEV